MEEQNQEKKQIITSSQEGLYDEYPSIDIDFFKNIESVEDMICVICQNIPNPEYAKEVLCCNHLYCEKCINQWQLKGRNCPLCKENIPYEDIFKKIIKIKDHDKEKYSKLSNSEIKCPLECEWTGLYKELNNHFKCECPNYKKKCKYSIFGCKFCDKREKLIEHENNNDKYHLKLAFEYEKGNHIIGGKVSCHQHILFLMPPKEGWHWKCDGFSIPSNDCPCGDKIYYTPRFHCDICDYDFCPSCFYKYLEK